MAERRQTELLKPENWDVLIILDAARPDYVHRLWPQFGTVRALGGITHRWLEHFWKLVQEPMVYFTANPVVTKVHKKVNPPGVTLVELWRNKWEIFGPCRLGSVHPQNVNAAVIRYLGKQPCRRRLVVHYLQPHGPYIGDIGLPVQVGNLNDGPTGKKGDRSVMACIKGKYFTWQDVRLAYDSNLRLVMPYAMDMTRTLKRQGYTRIIITADHGEALGDRHSNKQFYGHAGIPYALIQDVPFWQMKQVP